MSDKTKDGMKFFLVSMCLSIIFALMVWTHILDCEADRKIAETYQILGALYEPVEGKSGQTSILIEGIGDGVIIEDCVFIDPNRVKSITFYDFNGVGHEVEFHQSTVLYVEDFIDDPSGTVKEN